MLYNVSKFRSQSDENQVIVSGNIYTDFLFQYTASTF